MEENYYLAKWMQGEMTAEELEKFKNHPDFHLYQKIKEYSGQLESPNFAEEKMLASILKSEKNTPKVMPLYSKWWVQIAAVVLVALGITYFYGLSKEQTQYAENGTQISFALPDQSQITLNSGSTITYSERNWDSNRNLNLTGEAYFKVAKGKKFTVHTSLGDITVLGTQFNVKARNNRLDVVCYEGKVQVQSKQYTKIITKKENVSLVEGHPIVLPPVTTEAPVWTKKEIEFVKNNLAEVLQEIERKFNIAITNNAAPTSQLFSGTLPANNAKETLEIIAATYHLQSIATSKNTYLLENINAKK